MNSRLILLAFLTTIVHSAQAQTGHADLLQNLTPRQLGPTVMGGRIADIAVYEKEPRIFYVATAAGGLFKTENAGLTFQCVFQNEGSISLGAVAVSQSDPNLVWVGTGEASNRNSVAWGDGAYKSTDGGKTWTHVGLEKTQQISKVVIDPKDPNTVYVAAVGPLWSAGEDRGVYKTTDAGKTFTKILYVDDKTGPIDLKMDPSNNRNLLCAMYQRLRKPYDFISGGPGSAMYRSTDGGAKWEKITKGMPPAPYGRMGFSFYRKNSKIVVATIEYKPQPDEKDRLRDGGQTKNYAGGTFRSEDGGQSWKRISYFNPRPFYFSIPNIDPNDDKRLYVPSDRISYSEDGGKTFKVMGRNVHPDDHAWWVDPADSNHIIIGNDGGVYQTRDKGATWEHENSLPIGQYYAVAVDMRKPYWVYGGLQDNGCWGFPTQTSNGGPAYWDALDAGGGDGFHVAVDPNEWWTVYTESQGGALSRFDMRMGNARGIVPAIDGETIRRNWSTPFIISPNNARTLYYGANRLFKTIDQGNHWKPISPDLSTNDKTKLEAGKLSVTPEATGAEMHCTIVTISESPRLQGLLYVGTDDGQVQVSKDDGGSWSNVTKNIPDLPASTWCSRVLASKWSDSRVYATFDGHRGGDFKPYVYVSEDYGKTWAKLNTGLSDFDCVYVIAEGMQNEDLLYLGSEMSLRMSFDKGKSWDRFRSGFPTMSVHDFLVHPRDLDLVIGTHGRSLWTLDVSGLEQLSAGRLAGDAYLCKPQEVLLMGNVQRRNWSGEGPFLAPNSQPGTRIMYYLKKVPKDIKLTVSDSSGNDSDDLTATSHVGLNVVPWNGRVIGRGSVPGEYRITLTVDGKTYTTSATVTGFANDGTTRSSGDDGDGDGK